MERFNQGERYLFQLNFTEWITKTKAEKSIIENNYESKFYIQTAQLIS